MFGCSREGYMMTIDYDHAIVPSDYHRGGGGEREETGETVL
jgi:hypothetical protein